MNRCLAEKMLLSLFREQILHFTCDINCCFLNYFIMQLDNEVKIQGHIPQFS